MEPIYKKEIIFGLVLLMVFGGISVSNQVRVARLEAVVNAPISQGAQLTGVAAESAPLTNSLATPISIEVISFENGTDITGTSTDPRTREEKVLVLVLTKSTKISGKLSDIKPTARVDALIDTTTLQDGRVVAQDIVVVPVVVITPPSEDLPPDILNLPKR